MHEWVDLYNFNVYKFSFSFYRSPCVNGVCVCSAPYTGTYCGLSNSFSSECMTYFINSLQIIHVTIQPSVATRAPVRLPQILPVYRMHALVQACTQVRTVTCPSMPTHQRQHPVHLHVWMVVHVSTVFVCAHRNMWDQHANIVKRINCSLKNKRRKICVV